LLLKTTPADKAQIKLQLQFEKLNRVGSANFLAISVADAGLIEPNGRMVNVFKRPICGK
jgi:hypothetical protein